MAASPESYFRRHGLKPMTWDEILLDIEAKLKPADLEIFKLRHRNFVEYPVDHTCRAFYDFAATHALLEILASFRFERLCRIAQCLSVLPLRDRNLLEIGAGGGFLSGYLKEELGANISVTDWSTQTLDRLKEKGFKTFTSEKDPALIGKPFDFIFSADSLGEVNADDDSWLREPENANDPGYVDELEQRYGFSSKLAPLKSLLAPHGNILIFEPIGLPMFWNGAVASLQRSGWEAGIIGPEPVWGFVAKLA